MEYTDDAILVAVGEAEERLDFVADGVICIFHTPLIETGQLGVLVGSHGGIDTDENTVPFGGIATTVTIPASAFI